MRSAIQDDKNNRPHCSGLFLFYPAKSIQKRTARPKPSRKAPPRRWAFGFWRPYKKPGTYAPASVFVSIAFRAPSISNSETETPRRSACWRIAVATSLGKRADNIVVGPLGCFIGPHSKIECLFANCMTLYLFQVKLTSPKSYDYSQICRFFENLMFNSHKSIL